MAAARGARTHSHSLAWLDSTSLDLPSRRVRPHGVAAVARRQRGRVCSASVSQQVSTRAEQTRLHAGVQAGLARLLLTAGALAACAQSSGAKAVAKGVNSDPAAPGSGRRSIAGSMIE